MPRWSVQDLIQWQKRQGRAVNTQNRPPIASRFENELTEAGARVEAREKVEKVLKGEQRTAES